MQGQTRNIKTAMVATVVAIAMVAVLFGPSAVLAQNDTGRQRDLSYSQRLTTSPPAAKFQGIARDLSSLRKVTPRRAAVIPTPKVATSTRSLTTASTGSSGSSGSTGGTSELSQAQSILAGYIAKYPILAGTTVSFGQTPGGYQAVAYYTAGRILINPNHTASLSRIIGHEIWHVIDYRDNGRIDWGENVPPANYP